MRAPQVAVSIHNWAGIPRPYRMGHQFYTNFIYATAWRLKLTGRLRNSADRGILNEQNVWPFWWKGEQEKRIWTRFSLFPISLVITRNQVTYSYTRCEGVGGPASVWASLNEVQSIYGSRLKLISDTRPCTTPVYDQMRDQPFHS